MMGLYQEKKMYLYVRKCPNASYNGDFEPKKQKKENKNYNYY